MKKILLLATILALPMVAFAQGRVNFANAGFAIQTNFTSVGGTVGNANRTFSPLRVGLFVGPDGSSSNSLTLAVNNVGGGFAWATNQSAPFSGAFNGGNNFEIQGNAGTAISFQIRAWSLAYTTFNEAFAAYNAGVAGTLVGASAIGSITPATGATPTPNLFGAGAGQIAAFQAFPPSAIPEPSSIALGLLGLGAVALFRRRK